MFGPANRLVAPAGLRVSSHLPEMREPLAFSAGGHLAILLLAVIGLPFLHSKPLDPVKTISITMVAPSDMARTKHVAPPTQDKEDDDEPDTANQPPVVSSLPPPPPPEPVPQPVTPPPPKPEPLPVPKADIAPIEKLKPLEQALTPMPQVAPLPTLQKPLPMVKPMTLPPPPKPPEKVTQKQDQDFQSLVTNLAQPVEKADQVTHDKPSSHHQHQSAIAEASNQMTADELAALREALKRCWIIPAGVMNAENLVVIVEADYNENMTMKGVPTLVDADDRYNRDPAYRAAADSALRALRSPECSTLPFPSGKYEDWHHINLTFDPKTMISP